jgi:hypothetical protein
LKQRRYQLLEIVFQCIKNEEAIIDFNLLKDKEFLKKLFSARNIEIVKYFQMRKNKLLLIDISKEKDISKILKFLNLSTNKNFDMPHLNKTNE